MSKQSLILLLQMMKRNSGNKKLKKIYIRNAAIFVVFLACVLLKINTSAGAVVFHPEYKDTTKKDSLPQKPRTRVFIASPTLTYAPETRFAGGVFALYYFRLSRRRSDTRASSVDLSVKYTQNKQLIVEPTWKIFSKRDRNTITGDAIYQDFREYFYGIGNDLPHTNEEAYSFKMWRFNSKFQHRIFERFFIGPHYHFQKMYKVQAREGGLLEANNITGSYGGIASGLGVAATLDYRNSVLTPTEGFYTDFSNIYFIPSFGSDFTFTSYTFDARKYFKTFRKHILAFQGIFTHLSGDPPFRMQAMLGGPQMMRGYYLGRYRDRNSLAAQMEYRLPLFWRIGMTGFLSAGEVSHALNEFSFKGLHYGYGLGLRVLLNKKENLNARIDVGFGGEKPGVYATVGEAF